MYLDSMFVYNTGPVERCVIKARFDEQGNPIPIIIIGDNGKGKTVVSSYVTDSFIEFAKKGYPYNVVKKEKAFYKTVSSHDISSGKEYNAVILDYKDGESSYFYVDRAGKVNVDEIKADLVDIPEASIKGIEDNLKSEKIDLIKAVTINNKQSKKLFENNVICSFPADRTEMPWWLNPEAQERVNPYQHVRIEGNLESPIIIDTSANVNASWIYSILCESMIDPESPSSNVLPGNKYTYPEDKNGKIPIAIQIRILIQKILRIILKCRSVILTVAPRNLSDSFEIVEVYNNESGKTKVLSNLSQLSLGESCLFNIFVTILRYADGICLNSKSSPKPNITGVEGIVVIDEIDAHLDADMQHNVLPQLMQLFPKIQFIITTHSPLFLLGLEENREKQDYMLIAMPDGRSITPDNFSEFEKIYDMFKDTDRYRDDAYKLALQMKGINTNKILLITEGKTDYEHINHALNKLKAEGKYPDLEIEYYEEKNPGAVNGWTAVMNSWKNLTYMYPTDKKYVFLVDRDIDMKSANGFAPKSSSKDKYVQKGNVFSMLLPVPNFREEEKRVRSQDIAIEYYYDNHDLITEVDVGGTAKRLFLSDEFDSSGKDGSSKYEWRNIASSCAKQMQILTGDKFDILNNNKQKCILKKEEFFDLVVNNEQNNVNCEHFCELFDILEEISKL